MNKKEFLCCLRCWPSHVAFIVNTYLAHFPFSTQRINSKWCVLLGTKKVHKHAVRIVGGARSAGLFTRKMENFLDLTIKETHSQATSTHL
jgi:hypothetical protein